MTVPAIRKTAATAIEAFHGRDIACSCVAVFKGNAGSLRRVRRLAAIRVDSVPLRVGPGRGRAGRFPLVPAGVSIIVRPRLFGRRGDPDAAAVLLHGHRGRLMPKRLHGKTPLGIFGRER